MVGAGLRISEARALPMSAIEFDEGRVRVMVRTLKKRAKLGDRGSEYRQITLPGWAAAPVTRYVRRGTPLKNGYLFPARSCFKGQPIAGHLSLRGAEKIIRRCLDDIGRQDLTGHACRHTFGSLVTKTTRSIFVAQKLLGHSSPTVTARVYSVFDTEDADAAADSLAGVVKRGRGAR